MEDNFGIKELYDVSLKATFPFTIGSKEFTENETIIRFNKIQIAPLTERKSRFSSRGGESNVRLIDWEDTTEVDFVLSEGVISKTGLALLSNSILEKNSIEKTIIPYSQELESDENGKIVTRYNIINDNTLFVYDKNTGEKIDIIEVKDNTILIASPYVSVIVDYTFLYLNNSESYFIGRRLLDGYLRLDGKIRLRDDEDGHIKTGIIEFPRVKLMSDLNMRLGSNVGPHVYRFNLVGLPFGYRKDKYVCKITILDTELPSEEG